MLTPYSRAPAPDFSPYKRIAVAGISSTIWLIGIFVLHWDTFELHYLFMLDMFLFLAFGYLRVIFSLDRDKTFFVNFRGRLVFGFIVSACGGGMVAAFSAINPISYGSFHHFIYSPNHWTYDIIIINYTGFFVHDFIYTGKYKISNPFVEGSADFISVLIMVFVIGAALMSAPDTRTEEHARIYWLFSSVGIIAARFGLDVFFSLKARTFLDSDYGTEKD
jgi:hypothetical protein